ncbi:uncharacterized protein LOC128280483 [Gossypium arboreum]|uniref:uncharacterized protein LOC128280483 n=1 Tax=Gossypium arboreum TaxID=29729 RepID=UPI0022F14FD3|nr:uncharacterized protein LOC128280483 [Gossypium arboreum]
MAMQQLYGDWDESYNELQSWISAMVKYVPGTVVDLQTLPYRGSNGELELGKRVFRRLFWTFDLCVRAFSHCKPILLIVVAQDGNGNVLPITFSIVESENSESWAYFIRNLRRHVVRQDNICIISDRSKSFVAAIRQLEVPWRSVYCIRHIALNFHDEYKNKDWRKRIVNMGYELEPHQFRHKLARLETNMAGCKPSLTQWLSSMEPWQWAQCFDERYRYGHMTTNLVEVVNSVLRQYISRRGSRHGLMELISETGGVSARCSKHYGNRRCECRMFQALRYPCTHMIAACATYSLNAEQYIDDVYTLERMLRIWGNELPVLRDISTWEVQSPAFEMLPDM